MLRYLLVLFVFCSLCAQGQIIHEDEVDNYLFVPEILHVTKNWTDANGANTLHLTVDGNCNPDNAHFGTPTSIQAQLENKNYKVKIKYNEPDYQMCMIHLSEKDIWFYEYNGAKAVFIPFSYCGNLDSTVKLSYIILYNKHKCLLHFLFNCEEDPEENGICTLDNKTANKEVKKIPKELRSILMNYLKENYKTESDLN